ncbi:DUF6161 domain-containing protein [Rhodopseudomonas palustris]|uniref:DUF6161 domain-containing protein n=1 Tax=Rhodopseudomonas palustris TaxID=1076 RepID=UPI0020CC4BFD|nr:DUF6161 domain-containing protein [Rhodopseudomonas palustris]MCP9627366.1 DUF6161 domain-containing protein [Rhodopseudomonas palustris]
MSERSVRFTRDERAEAEKLKESQQRFWRSIFSDSEIYDFCRSAEGQSRWNRDYVDTRVEHAFELKETSETDGGVVVRGTIPILNSRSADKIRSIAATDKDLVRAATLIECRSIFAEFNTSNLPLALLSSMIEYSSGGTTKVELSARIWEFSGKMERAQQSAGLVADKLREDVSKSISDGQEQLAAYKQSLSEEVKLRSASALWSERAFWHRATAMMALAAFFGLICGSLWYLADHFNSLVNLLPRDKDGHVEYVSIALLAIPAIGVGWLLRVLARFVQSNSILGDDSRQRQAMIRTYLALVADKDAQVTEKDRLVMLNAIFRPLPGTQIDEVAPPTILDLLKKEP